MPPRLASAAAATLESWTRTAGVRRLWDRDPTLWTGQDEGRWLGWLDGPATGLAARAQYQALARESAARQLSHALLVGMGGSSLAPEVFAQVFGAQAGHPRLLVLDSTDPSQIAAIERQLDLSRTLVIVSSKSGTTLETSLLGAYFYQRIAAVVGAKEAGSRFVAITDPGSALERVATQDGYWRILRGEPAIGGRFSALSPFGLAPAAIAGIDIEALLLDAGLAVSACRDAAQPRDNPGLTLGIALGEAARLGRDKLTLVCSRSLAPLGAWLEQLIAESTGKLGKGIIPIDGEPLAAPERYGSDRVFAHLRLVADPDDGYDERLARLERAGHPVIRTTLADRVNLAQELFRWEFATAVTGAVLGIHPFDQPDVEASKIETRKRMSGTDAAVQATTDAPIASAETLRRFFASVGEGDYVAILAYLEMSAANRVKLTNLRELIRIAKTNATAVQFGPRFLHSTGQAYKGGPNAGAFIVLTCDETQDLPAPGLTLSFGQVKTAQALGDAAVLQSRGRRVLRIHLGADIAAGLDTLVESARVALKLAGAA